jgi:CBS-domain-containing membrane protein
MPVTTRTKPRSALTLRARTAEELMHPNPVSLRAEASIPETLALLVDKGVSAAPVIDEAGRPIGVVSRTDLLAYERETLFRPASQRPAETPGASAANSERTRVRDIMTPVVFSVALDAPMEKVVAEMVSLNVHHLFVVDHDGVLVGVVSPLDVLQHLE